MQNKINIGLIGAGTVGGGTYKILKENFSEIFRKTGKEIIVFALAEKDLKRAKEIVDDKTIVYEDAFDIVKDKNIHVIIELIGGTGVSKNLVEEAIKNNKHVITANKALIAMHGEELVSLAREHNVNLAYEAAVAGGIPIIKSVREGLAGNKIEWIVGILNGTTNYILTEMKENNLAFDVALKQAQDLGFAEADPSFDIEGVDAAHKITILASIAFGIPINFNAVHIEGISNLEQKDIIFAEEIGYKIKLLGITKHHHDSVELRVHPTLIPEKKLVANVDGPMNAVLVQGNMVGPTLYYGAGAGAEPTASAVVADIIDLARNLESTSTTHIPILGFIKDEIKPKKILLIEDITSEFYLRFSMQNESGVVEKIKQVFELHSIGIGVIVQKEIKKDDGIIDIILVTSNIIEKNINEIINEIEVMPENKNKIVKLRIEQLNS
ncbi:homoserine dehydrogenase [Methylophilaceae bacterium]|nr:homoserine dehydrogenase [Methylophilaceae bacterium]|tara:strand:- start:28099 stop:29415 length:1317 start_codon:yes stop_codon:yes gene_type:complete